MSTSHFKGPASQLGADGKGLAPVPQIPDEMRRQAGEGNERRRIRCPFILLPTSTGDGSISPRMETRLAGSVCGDVHCSSVSDASRHYLVADEWMSASSSATAGSHGRPQSCAWWMVQRYADMRRAVYWFQDGSNRIVLSLANRRTMIRVAVPYPSGDWFVLHVVERLRCCW